MKYSIDMVEAASVRGVLRVEVTQGGKGINGPRLELRSGAWLGPVNKPQMALAGDKDSEGEPGVAEFVNMARGMFLLGIEVQPERLVHIPLNLFFLGAYRVRVDLTAPWEPPGEPGEAQVGDDVG